MLGEIISEYRYKHKLSLREFGSRANLSHSYIDMIEKNSNTSTNKSPVVSFDALKNIAKAMNMNVNNLINMLDGEQVLTAKKQFIEYKDNIEENKLNIQYSEDFNELEKEQQKEIEKQTQDILNALILQKKQEKLDRLNKKKEVDNED